MQHRRKVITVSPDYCKTIYPTAPKRLLQIQHLYATFCSVLPTIFQP